MKRQLLLLACFLNLVILTYGGHKPPIRTMIIPYTPVPFNIDGNDNEAHWSAEQSTDAFNLTGWTDNADFTFDFKIAWDENYLYVYGKILDDFNSSWEWGESNQWTFDNVELYMDLDTNGSGNISAYDSNTYEVRFNRGIDSVGDAFGRACKRSDHKYSWKNSTDGWVFETALAWKFVLGPGQRPEDILSYTNGIVSSGFEIIGSDSDNDGPDHRDCQTAWDSDEPEEPCDLTEGCNNNNAWNNRSVFGVVTFQPRYTTETDEYNSPHIVAYPNPTTGLVTFENIQSSTIEILNLAGQIVLSPSVNNRQIDISILPKGIYFTKSGQHIIKLIKQ